jgi:hypothetical protein
MVQKRREAQLVQLKIRIRERLRQQLEQSAKEQEIPLTHEIVRRLERSFEGESLIRIRDQAEKALASIQEQVQRRDYLLELEMRQLGRAFDERVAEEASDRQPKPRPFYPRDLSGKTEEPIDRLPEFIRRSRKRKA